MNYLRYFANHGIRFYLDMNAEDYIFAMGQDSELSSKYPDAVYDLDQVTKAMQYRDHIRQQYVDAVNNLEAVKVQANKMAATLVTHMDSFNGAVQTYGGFMADGPCPVPQFVQPMMSVTQAYSVMQNGNEVSNFSDQITTVLEQAKADVEKYKTMYEEARKLEHETINTSIYKLTILHL